MHREVTDWADFVDENSNLSMKSVDFGELPLQKLERSNSRSRDPDLGYSREGLNLLVTNALKLNECSTSNCSTSRKRLRNGSIEDQGPRDFSRFVSKRPKTAIPGSPPSEMLAPHPVPQVGPPIPSVCPPIIGKSSLRPQLNFAGILKATKAKKKKDYIQSQREKAGSTKINSSSNPPNPRQTKSDRSWAQRFFCASRVNKQNEQLQCDTNKPISVPKRFEEQVFKPPVRRKLKTRRSAKSLRPNIKGSMKNVISKKEKLETENIHNKEGLKVTRRKNRNSLKVNTSVKTDLTEAALDQSSENKIILSISTCKSPRAEQTSLVSLPPNPTPEKSLMETDNQKPSLGQCQVMWRMPKKQSVIITKTKNSPEILMWGSKIPLIQNFCTPCDKAETTAIFPKCSVTSKTADDLEKTVSVHSLKKLPNGLKKKRSSKSSKGSCPPKKANCVTALQENVALSSISPDPTPHIASARSPLPFVVKTEGSGKRSPKVAVAPNSNALGQIIIMTDVQIQKRKKQIEFGKRTAGYLNYLKEVPKDKRGNKHPQTPDIMERISKRRFTGKLHTWRRKLHQWDDPESQGSAGSVPPLPLKIPVSAIPPVEENKCSDNEKMSLAESFRQKNTNNDCAQPNKRRNNTTVNDCAVPNKKKKE